MQLTFPQKCIQDSAADPEKTVDESDSVPVGVLQKSIFVTESHSGAENGCRKHKIKAGFSDAVRCSGILFPRQKCKYGENCQQNADPLQNAQSLSQKQCGSQNDQNHIQSVDRGTDSRALPFHGFHQQNVGAY